MEIEIRSIEIRSFVIPTVKIIGLSDLDDTASFHCPNCGSRISPDDETEDVYSIIDHISDGNLQAVMISCQCSQQVVLDLTPSIPMFPSILDIIG